MKKYFQKLIFFIFFVPIYFFSLENLNTHPLSDDFADLVEKLSPAVVSIASTTIIDNNSQNQIPQFPEGSPFDEFFKDWKMKILKIFGSFPANSKDFQSFLHNFQSVKFWQKTKKGPHMNNWQT